MRGVAFTCDQRYLDGTNAPLVNHTNRSSGPDRRFVVMKDIYKTFCAARPELASVTSRNRDRPEH